MLRLLFLLALLVASFGCGAATWSSTHAERVEPTRVELASESGPVAIRTARSSPLQVHRSPVLERLPVVAARALPLASRPRHAQATAIYSGDTGESCLQIRRRLPRMQLDEPPWS